MTLQEIKRYIYFLETLLDFLKASEHKLILPDRGPEEFRNQAENGNKGRFILDGHPLGKE